jgi:hypothetical protein
MTTPNLQARRATIEDLQRLMPLWERAGLPAGELGKRLQEFQVVEAENGEITGALGFQIAGHDARLHHECFARAEDADAVRAKLWERVQMISKNHGLVRMWTQHASPFWKQSGFQPPPPEVAGKLPAVFAGQPEPWSFLQLREDVAASPTVEKEFAMFKELQQEERERAFRQARRMKLVALVAVVAVFILLVVWAVVWLKTPLARNR